MYIEARYADDGCTKVTSYDCSKNFQLIFPNPIGAILHRRPVKNHVRTNVLFPCQQNKRNFGPKGKLFKNASWLVWIFQTHRTLYCGRLISAVNFLQEKRNYFIGVLDIAGFEIFDVSIYIIRTLCCDIAGYKIFGVGVTYLGLCGNEFIHNYFVFFFLVQLLWTIVHQFDQRETTTIFQPHHVRTGTRRVPERRH